MNERVYIDESKARNYLMVAAAVIPTDDREVRRAVAELLLPGQRRLHMKNESDRRRRKILSVVADLSLTARLYDAGAASRPQLVRRRACIDAIVLEATQANHGHLVFEQDESLVRADREALIEAIRAARATHLTYEHRQARDELLLAIPDALAWAWAKGGDWRRRAGLVVIDVKKV